MTQPTVIERARQHKHAYAGDEDRPLGTYTALVGLYAALGLGTLTTLARRRERLAPGDIALLSVATFKASRVLTKGTVTSPLRAPFTRFAGTSGPSELHEEMRVDGPRRAIGELLTCPFCLSQWIATSLAAGFFVAPRQTRAVTSVLTAVAGADFLQLLYAQAEQAAEG
ncbi:uncharacterized protein DUF1360 [Motilibacter rhizosphaerae]|uniref:Uncharacterized protein DUF1360 n=1 Tax=Motilibacter rhizosphaerae TaxID=598652 RepID=A0A4Q7NX10_9ACTN|nr:DUF1360 domain-containing protein [Motilibacter rhizosphaerae]RZS91744.1 uncharacterized protein DUF1360 [Motilibacter rhizosphaerae]